MGFLDGLVGDMLKESVGYDVGKITRMVGTKNLLLLGAGAALAGGAAAGFGQGPNDGPSTWQDPPRQGHAPGPPTALPPLPPLPGQAPVSAAPPLPTAAPLVQTAPTVAPAPMPALPTVPVAVTPAPAPVETLTTPAVPPVSAAPPANSSEVAEPPSATPPTPETEVVAAEPTAQTPPPPPVPAPTSPPELESEPASQGQEGGAPIQEPKISPELTFALVRTMVSAALADGLMDDREKDIILERLKHSGLDAEKRQRIHRDLEVPASPAELATMTDSQDEREAMFRFAGLILLSDQKVTELERDWLDRLAFAFGFDVDRKVQLETEVLGE